MRAVLPLQPPCPGATDQLHAPKEFISIKLCKKRVCTKLAADAAEVRALVYLGILCRLVRRRNHLAKLVDYRKAYCSRLV